MIVIPAVDIMGSKVVRLNRGKPKTAKIYGHFGGPLQVAKKWETDGASYLHIVDLDAATGQGNNEQTIETIIQGVGIKVQVGGGIRTQAMVEKLLGIGVSRVIVATLAFEREDLLKLLVKEFGCKRVMVALDYLKGIVMIKGWKGSTGLSLENAIEKFSNLGVKLFLLTSISRDGNLAGPDYITLKIMVKHFKKGLFVAGGVSSVDDLVKLKAIGVDGVVVGKALYEGRFSLKNAIDALRG